MTLDRDRVWAPSLLLVVLALLSSCTHAGPGRTQRAAWSRAVSDHFTLYTDLPPAEAKARGVELEQLLSAYFEHGWERRGELPIRLNVVMFRHPSDVAPFTGPRVVAYHVSERLLEPWIVLSPRDGIDVLRHELTHYIAHQAIQDQPPWLAEGLACYFETAHFHNGMFVIGAASSERWVELSRGLLPAASLMDEHATGQEPLFNSNAWLLVHYLMSEHGEAFASYQDELARGSGHALAWKKAFPDLSADQLTPALRHNARRGLIAKYALPVKSVPTTVAVTSMTRADEQALFAVLWTSAFEGGATAQARAEQSMRAALALDSQQLQARALQILDFTGDAEAAIADARALVAAHPDEALAWLTLGLGLARAGQPSAHEAPSPAERALALAPHHPYAWMLGAFAQAGNGQREQALRMSLVAQRLQPTNPNLLMMRAHLLAALSECEELRGVTATIGRVGHERLLPRSKGELAGLAEICARRRTELAAPGL